jgi:hypothetical protein
MDNLSPCYVNRSFFIIFFPIKGKMARAIQKLLINISLGKQCARVK